MSEEIIIPPNASREDVYQALKPQIAALLSGEDNFVANTANFVAAIRQSLGFHWVGVYLVDQDSLVLGPFQGPVACTRIPKGKGVCGHAWVNKKTIVVPDVDLFPGHIACSSLSRSEIVIPLFTKQGDVFGVLDVDSSAVNDFTETDSDGLTMLCHLLEEKYA